MPQAAARHLVDVSRTRRGRGRLDRNFRRPRAAEGRQRAFELGPPGCIPRVLEAVADARVEDDNRQLGRQWHEPVLLEAAVEKKRVTALCE